MRVERALGKARGAGGVEDEHGVVLVGLGAGPGRLGRGQAALAEVGQGLQRPRQGHGGQAGQREGFILKQRFVDEQRGLAIAHQIIDFAAGQPVVDGHEDEAGFLGGHEQGHVLQTVLGQHHEAVALSQAVGLGELGGEVVGGLVQLGVGVGAVGIQFLQRHLLRRVKGPLGNPIFGVHDAAGIFGGGMSASLTEG